MSEFATSPRRPAPSGFVVSDVALSQAAAKGDPAAFHMLIDRHAPSMLRLALSLSGNRSDAEDICQETFIAAFRGIKRFDGRASVKTWLTRILIRRAAKAWKKNRHVRRMTSLQQILNHERSGSESDRTISSESSASSTDSIDRRLDILEVIRALPREFRDVIILREIEGYSYQEIANALGLPLGTIDSRIYRARAELRRKLTGY